MKGLVTDFLGWPLLRQVTADFAYVRLHGDTELYRSRYDDEALIPWADRIERWARGGRDVNGRIVSGSTAVKRASCVATGPRHSLPWQGPVPKPV